MPRKPVVTDKEVAESEAKLSAVSEAAARRGKGKKEKSKWKLYVVGAVGVGMCLLAIFLAISPAPQKKGAATKLDNYVNDAYTISDVTTQAEGNFTAAASPFFNKWTLNDAKYGLGGVGVSNMLGISGAVQVCPEDEGLEGGVIPPAYDARDNWPACFHEAYDSGNCSASYAIAAAEVLGARFCIADPAKYSGVKLSPQQILSCDKKSRGCNGGGVDSVWSYIQRRGLYPEECVPYVGEKGTQCKSECDESKKLRVLDHCVLTREKAVKREIYNKGPVAAPLYLKTEYLVYSSGVYTPTESAEQMFDSRDKAAMTAVMVLGWGKSQGSPYWIVKHSWGSSWGENGYARVSMDGVLNDNYVVVVEPATEEAIQAAAEKKVAAEKRKEDAKAERAARDERIKANREQHEAQKAAEKEAQEDKDLDDDDDFNEAEVDLDVEDS